MSKLRDLSGEPGLGRITDILSTEPYLNLDKTIWPYAGAKAGSEAGVANFTWLLRRADGRWFVVSLTLNNPTKDMGVLSADCLGGDAISLLGVAP